MSTKYQTMLNSKTNRAIAIFLFLLIVTAAFQAAVYALDKQKDYAPFPQPDSGYVTDLANLLGKKKEERIEQWLWDIEKKTKVEIIVVTISSIEDYPETPNGTIEEFATALFNTYGIGNMPKNNGVLLLVAVKDRKARIELGSGYGRHRDADASRIMDKIIVPKFKNADYAAGITNGVKAITLEFAEARIGINWMLICSVLAVLVCGIIGISLILSGKKGWGWVFVGLAFILLLFVGWIVFGVLRTGRSISGSSGGLGGFGGGSSGGGGATGSW